MHIVHLETGRHIYGGSRQVLMLLAGLAQAGCRTTLVCPDDSAIATAANTGNTEVVTMPMRGDLDIAFVGRLSRWLKHADADLLHVHSRRGAELWGGLAARRAGVPALLTRRVDNAEPPVLGRLKYRMYRRIVAISAAIEQQLIADGAAANRLRLVHSAIDADNCEPSWTRAQFLDAFNLTPDNLAVVCVAQFIPRKGHMDLLAAWSDVAAACPQARLVLFGQGPEEAALRAVVAQRQLESTVKFAGFREDLRHYLGHADALVHPAHQEGLGVCLLEAQAAGVPIVATRAGGIPEAVIAGESALLVAPHAPAALAAALVGLLDDVDQRAAMAAAGSAHVRSAFSPAAMVSGNLDIYKELLE
jgi:glycosyltransferase involved in cell wall biosynthesis